MIDMSSAFDLVDHNILLDRLSYCCGVKNSVLTCFQYSCSHSQSVVVNIIVSSSFELSSDVPQGSVLAPILFKLYVKLLDLADSAKSNLFTNCLRAIKIG